MPWEQASRLIQRYESGGRNVMNNRFGEDPEYYTASGPWQITRGNFHEYGRQLGIDTSRWNYAKEAPLDVQERIARAMYERNGFNDWAPYNAELRRALGMA